MWPDFLTTVYLPEVQFGQQQSTAQTLFVSQLMAYQGMDVEEKNKVVTAIHENEEWLVTGGPSAGINEWLTFYGILAYHWDEAAALITEHYPDATSLQMSVGDREMFAACLLSAACGESLGGADEHGMDVPQIYAGGVPAQPNKWNPQWYAMSYEDKAAALKQYGSTCWANATWGTQYRAGSDNTYAWGYGLYQFTWGRRVNLVLFCEEMGLDFTSGYGQAMYTIAEFMDVSGMTGRDTGVTLLSGYKAKHNLVATATALKSYPKGINTDDWGNMVDLVHRNHIYGSNTLTNPNTVTRTNRHDMYLSNIRGQTLQRILQAYQMGGVDMVNTILS